MPQAVTTLPLLLSAAARALQPSRAACARVSGVRASLGALRMASGGRSREELSALSKDELVELVHAGKVELIFLLDAYDELKQQVPEPPQPQECTFLSSTCARAMA